MLLNILETIFFPLITRVVLMVFASQSTVVSCIFFLFNNSQEFTTCFLRDSRKKVAGLMF